MSRAAGIRVSNGEPPASETRIRVAVHQALSDLEWRGRRACYVGRRNVGLFRRRQDDTLIRIGVTGQADLTGFLCTGRAFECEVKTKVGELSAEQVGWQQLCLSMNVLWILARSPEQACAVVLGALDGTLTL